MKRAALSALLLCTACAHSPSGPLDAGTWGGEGIGLEVKSSSAHLEFDCGAGDIPAVLTLADGKFEARGTVIIGHGVSMVNEQPDVRPASFKGTVSGIHMTIDVTIGGSPPSTTRYQLLKGAPPFLRRCL